MGIQVQKFPYVSDLATFRSSEVLTYGTVVFLQGTSAPNDGGQAFYQVSLTDKSTADNGGSCIVDLAGYRWFRSTLPPSSGGVLPVSEGGTGDTTLTNHGVMLGQGTSPVVVTAVGATGTVLKGVTGADPAFGAVALTTDVTGTLPVTNGGTGAATLTSHGVLIGNGTSAVTVTAAGTATTVLHGNASGDPTFGAVNLATDVTGTVSVGNIPAFNQINVTGVNANSGNTDTAIPLTPPSGYTRFGVAAIRLTNATGTLTTMTFGCFTTTGGGGSPLITSGTACTVSTGSDASANNLQQANGSATTASFLIASLPNTPNIYFRVQTPQGVAQTFTVSAVINWYP